MTFKLLKTLAAICSVLLSSTLLAQDQNSSAYFMDGYTYRHEFNPAFASSRNYLALPALSNVSVSTRSKFGVGKYITEPNFSTNDLMGELLPQNRLMLGIDLNALSLGFWSKDQNFTTFGIKVKVDADINIPKDVFNMINNIEHLSNNIDDIYNKSTDYIGNYNIRDLSLRLNSYLETFYGFSTNINDNLRIGAKAKISLGVASADIKIDNMKIKITEDQVVVNSKGSARIAGNIANVPHDEDGYIDIMSAQIGTISNFNDICGSFKFATDLGATYTISDKLTFSASVLDLGFVVWNNSLYVTTENSSYDLNNLKHTFSNPDQSALSTLFSSLSSLKMLIRFKETEGKSISNLSARVNLGTEWNILNWLSVAALFSHRFNPIHSSSEARFFCNLEPANWLSLSGNWGVTESGKMVGAALAWNNRVFNLFIGTESIFTKYTPLAINKDITIPIPANNTNFSIYAGFVFNLSKRKDK